MGVKEDIWPEMLCNLRFGGEEEEELWLREEDVDLEDMVMAGCF